jgi:hypothetical protein
MNLINSLKNIVTPGWCTLVFGTGFFTYAVCGLICCYTNNIQGAFFSLILFLVYACLFLYFFDKWIKQ